MDADRFRASSDAFVGLDAMTSNDPIRRIDDVEIPVSGMWRAIGASSIVKSTDQRGSRVTPVVGGWLEVGEDPATTSLCIELDDSILLATTASVSHDGHAWSEWHLEGLACTGDRRDPLSLTLRYHGWFRSGVDAQVWWSGTGTIGAADGRRGRRGRRRSASDDPLLVELLFAAPGRRGATLSNVVAYMLRRVDAATGSTVTRTEDGVVDPTFGMLQRILGAARADLEDDRRTSAPSREDRGRDHDSADAVRVGGVTGSTLQTVSVDPT